MKNQTKNSGNICWLFLRASLGEFHVIVPELIHFAEQENLQLHISFLNNKIEKQFYDNPLYKKLAEHYFEVVERQNIISFAKKNKQQIKYLFRDLTGLNKYSVIRSIKILLPDAKLIMFPHAFSFYASKELANYQTLTIPPNNPFEDCVDAFITFTEADKEYFSERFPSESITTFTPRGLNKEWLHKLESLLPTEELKDFEEKYPKRVLLTIRHPHPVYLSEKNYYELLEEVIQVVKEFGYELFVKPHPRQNFEDFINYCQSNQLQVWTKDTYTSALFFKKVITFWSSASIDFAAFGIPSIEHFRYEKYHNQLVRKNGKLSSLYTNMGISLPSTNKPDLELAFKKMVQESKALGEEQQKNLRKTYSSPELNLNSMKFKTPVKFSLLVKWLHFARLYYYFLKNK